jgi:DNA-binding transcriptional LysR family regulator
MDLESLRIFLRVAKLGSFTHAADQLGMPKSRVSLRVRSVEAELGVRLLVRTTRSVRLTSDGEQLVARGTQLLQDADELTATFQSHRMLRGRVRVDLPVNFARDVLIPRLPELLSTFPNIELLMGVTDRQVELVREGVDCVVRVGSLRDSQLTLRRLGVLPMVNLASAGYLRKHGVPRSVEDLEQHVLVHYSATLGSDVPAFEHLSGERYVERPMRCSVSVNNADAYMAACIAGLGIIQTPRAGKMAKVDDGTLIELLPEHTARPMPVSIMHAHGRNVPRRVRVVMSWITQVLEPYLQT